MNDLFLELIKLLPDIIQVVFVILLLVSILISKAIIPVISFLSKKILNKTKNSLTEILSSKKLDKDLILESEKELSIIYKMELTQCRNRQLALYFYELSNESKHIFSYKKFKRLYQFLKLEKEDILINKKGIIIENLINGVMGLGFLTMALILGFLSILYAIKDFSKYFIDYFQSILLMVIFTMLACYFFASIIFNSEINQFNKIKYIYHKKIIARLTREYKDDYFS